MRERAKELRVALYVGLLSNAFFQHALAVLAYVNSLGLFSVAKLPGLNGLFSRIEIENSKLPMCDLSPCAYGNQNMQEHAKMKVLLSNPT